MLAAEHGLRLRRTGDPDEQLDPARGLAERETLPLALGERRVELEPAERVQRDRDDDAARTEGRRRRASRRWTCSSRWGVSTRRRPEPPLERRAGGDRREQRLRCRPRASRARRRTGRARGCSRPGRASAGPDTAPAWSSGRVRERFELGVEHLALLVRQGRARRAARRWSAGRSAPGARAGSSGSYGLGQGLVDARRRTGPTRARRSRPARSPRPRRSSSPTYQAERSGRVPMSATRQPGPGDLRPRVRLMPVDPRAAVLDRRSVPRRAPRASAEPVARLQQQDRAPAQRRLARSRHAGEPAADDEHVMHALHRAANLPVGVCLQRRPWQDGRRANGPSAAFRWSVAAVGRRVPGVDPRARRRRRSRPGGRHPEPWTVWRNWLAQRGLGLVPIAEPARFNWPGPWLALLRAADGDGTSARSRSARPGHRMAPARRAGDVRRGASAATSSRPPTSRSGRRPPSPRRAAPAWSRRSSSRRTPRRRWSASSERSRAPAADSRATATSISAARSPTRTAAATTSRSSRPRCSTTSGSRPEARAGRRRTSSPAGSTSTRSSAGASRIGEVECFGQRLCEPCAHLERLTAQAGKPGTLRALIHKGGLRADVLTDGEIRVGDPIVPGEMSTS